MQFHRGQLAFFSLEQNTLKVQVLDDPQVIASPVECYAIINEQDPLSLVLSMHENKSIFQSVISRVPDANWQMTLQSSEIKHEIIMFESLKQVSSSNQILNSQQK